MCGKWWAYFSWVGPDGSSYRGEGVPCSQIASGWIGTRCRCTAGDCCLEAGEVRRLGRGGEQKNDGNGLGTGDRGGAIGKEGR